MTDEQVISKIKKYVASLGSQKAAAESVGISPPHLSDILSGRRAPSESLLDAIGLERIGGYRKKRVAA